MTMKLDPEVEGGDMVGGETVGGDPMGKGVGASGYVQFS